MEKSKFVSKDSSPIRMDLVFLGWKSSILQALDVLAWEDSEEKNLKETKLILDRLRALTSEIDKNDDLEEALLSGRFDKRVFEFTTH